MLFIFSLLNHLPDTYNIVLIVSQVHLKIMYMYLGTNIQRYTKVCVRVCMHDQESLIIIASINQGDL